MARNQVTIELKPGNRPVFLRLTETLIADIERGRLKPGDALPGTRSLARDLGLHRNTVDAAYHELAMQGWVTAEPSRGTFVARDLPDMGRIGDRHPAPSRRTAPVTPGPPVLRVSDGAPDPRLVPRTELARAFRQALNSAAFLRQGGYGDPRGAPILRAALAGHLARERGLATTQDHVMVTRGSQMGLFLAATALLQPGQKVAVETPGYPLAWAAFRAAGARVMAVPVDAGGIDVDRLAEMAARHPDLRAVCVTPHHQYPTTVTLGAARRLRLLDVARRHGLTIIEDDYDHDYRFDGRPVLPLAARAEPGVAVIYVGSLSKLLAPAVRAGYVVAPPDVLARMAARREAIDRQGDVPLEHALAAMLDDGDLRRHARKARRVYAARLDVLAAEIAHHLGDAARFDTPAGGLALWVRLAPGLDAATWAKQAARAGLDIAPGCRFALYPAPAPQAFRIGYADLDHTDLCRVARLLAATRPTCA